MFWHPTREAQFDLGLVRMTGVLVSDRFKIGMLVLRDTHSDLYPITSEGNREPLHVEARVFKLTGIDKETSHYRRRNMRRLEPRTVYSTTVDGRVVIVYLIDSPFMFSARMSPDALSAAGIYKVYWP